jgi:hypothetical protein
VVARPQGSALPLWLIITAIGTTQSAVGGTAVESTRVYANREFGFSMAIPFYASACDPGDGGQETGIAFFLDGGSADCPGGMEERPYISVNFSYNAADYPSPAEILAAICDGAPIASPDPKQFEGLISRWPALCRIQDQSGTVRMILAGLEPKKRGKESEVMYVAFLQSSTQGLDTNLRLFTSVLRSIRTFPRRSD